MVGGRVTGETTETLEARRLATRRRALSNMLLALDDDGRRTRGRLEVQGMPDGVLLRYRDVVTLVAGPGGLAVAPRDFQVLVICPPLWPFDREAALVPIVLTPLDFAAPNYGKNRLCLDVRGVRPRRLAELLYDNLRLRNRRLDHCLDPIAADYVRSHLPDGPADPRPLYPTDPP
jgi:hypothetical protein